MIPARAAGYKDAQIKRRILLPALWADWRSHTQPKNGLL